MRFSSLTLLFARAAAVARRFPWTLSAGIIGAAAAVTAVDGTGTDAPARLAFVAALAIPTTLALTLLAERRHWPLAWRLFAPALGVLALGGFYAVWPGIDQKHAALRYFQLSAVVHLAVAFLPFAGSRHGLAFWQYNRRLFLGFLRSVVFSGVLFTGIAIAIAALDQLFGVDVADATYARIWLVMAFVTNTWIFLAVVPEDLDALAADTTYPRALKVFAQYILTPLAFVYLLLLLAYLVKLVGGAEWPNGWIGWLVSSVAVTGLLGFLLVHPLRADPSERWIRTYARGLFIGLIPAAIMLLVALWKRIEPYGLTEPRALGFLLGAWLLGLAIIFAVKPDRDIRGIPSSLALLLLLTLFGPQSLTGVSVASQQRRLRARLHTDAKEASAALRFLMDHRAHAAIAAAVGHELPSSDWEALRHQGTSPDSIGAHIMQMSGAHYVPEYASFAPDGSFFLSADQTSVMSVSGFEWVVPVHTDDTASRSVGGETVAVRFDTTTGIAVALLGADTVRFELLPVLARVVDSIPAGGAVRKDLLQVDPVAATRRARILLQAVRGVRTGDGSRIRRWSGSLLIGGRAPD